MLLAAQPFMLNGDTVRVVILDVHDAEIVADTRRAVHEAFRQRSATEQWVVSISASPTGGRWDLGIRGPVSQSVLSFAASPSLVPEFVSHYLSRHLAGLNSPGTHDA